MTIKTVAPLSPHPHRPPGRPDRRPPPTVWLEGVGHQGAHSTPLVGRCGLVLPQRIARRAPCPPPQEPSAERTTVCQARRPTGGPDVPLDIGREGGRGDGVCPAAVSPERPRDTPRSAPGKPEKDDRHTNRCTASHSVCGCVADHPQDERWGGHAASADALVSVTTGHTATTGLGD